MEHSWIFLGLTHVDIILKEKIMGNFGHVLSCPVVEL